MDLENKASSGEGRLSQKTKLSLSLKKRKEVNRLPPKRFQYSFNWALRTFTFWEEQHYQSVLNLYLWLHHPFDPPYKVIS
jgi:hypothetical protein